MGFPVYGSLFETITILEKTYFLYQFWAKVLIMTKQLIKIMVIWKSENIGRFQI